MSTLEKVKNFQNEWGGVVEFIAKPLFALFIVLLISYGVNFLDDNYVPREEFAKLAVENRTYYESTSHKLDNILLNQAKYDEQMRGLAQRFESVERRQDKTDDRVGYIERSLWGKATSNN